MKNWNRQLSRAVDYAPYIIAKNKGWFKDIAKKYGKEIDYAEFQSLAAINESFATGNIDIVFEAEAPAIMGKAAGMDIAIKGIEVSLVQEILVHKNSEIKEIKDLKGKNCCPFRHKLTLWSNKNTQR